MMLAPQVDLSGTLGALDAGAAGVHQTIQIMRRMVRNFRTDLNIRNAATTAVYLTPERAGIVVYRPESSPSIASSAAEFIERLASNRPMPLEPLPPRDIPAPHAGFA